MLMKTSFYMDEQHDKKYRQVKAYSV